MDLYNEYTDATFYAVWKIIPSTKTKITKKSSYDMFDVTVENAENVCLVVLALYDGDRLCDIQTEQYTGENISFATFSKYTNAKVMLLDNFMNMKPLGEAEEL